MNNCWQKILLCFSVAYPGVANAQIIPDASLGTRLMPNVNINNVLSDKIEGGVQRGANLFHSFQEFNVNTVGSVYFANPTDVTNIFTRVTGANPSNINGKLGVLGNANFFLLNPNGIVFGAAAELDVKGSFLGTTASSINFADGYQFGATNQQAPLLTVSVPVGLGFGSTPGSIQVQGVGHNLTSLTTAPYPIFSPYFTPPQVAPITGLQVKPGKTLALVGNEINLTGGVINAPGGRIELGSVGRGSQVGLNSTMQGLTLDYSNVSSLQNIQFSQRALASVSGFIAGEVQIQGKEINLYSGSAIWAQNRGTQQGGDINIRATQLLLNGTNNDRLIPSSIISETIGTGASGNINISTSGLIIEDGASLGSKTFSPTVSGVGGKVNVLASEFIKLRGQLPNSAIFNALGSVTFSIAKAGDVSISTRDLFIQDGSYIGSVSLQSGSGGNILINADTTEVIGGPRQFSSISGNSYNSGDSSNIELNTRVLNIRNGGSVSTSSLSTGAAGNITVNATESVEITGTMPGQDVSSSINSNVGSLSAIVRTLVPQAINATGNAGNLTINTPFLKLNNEGDMSVENFGAGSAGTLNINALSVELNNKASIGASTTSGKEGNIIIQAQNLQLRQNSKIATNARSLGNGGNININSNTIVQLENSDITANAILGRGGNININTQGIFRTFDSNITATGSIDGIVTITTPEIKQEGSLRQQPTNFVGADTIVANSCIAKRNTTQGKFVVTNNGGLPQTPDHFDLQYNVAQVQPVTFTNNMTQTSNKPKTSSSIPTWKLGDPIQEASQLVKTPSSSLLLIASSNVTSSQDLICSPKTE